MYHGIINIYKEKDFTSHDVVAKLRGICGQKKIGHTGTLDPQAEGVLPVCLGAATKLCSLLTDEKKEYVAEFLLGVTTDTQDMTGTVIKEREVAVSQDAVRKWAASFLGEIMQIPPMYSARKVNGKKLYELARAGIEVERAARPVTIYELEILEMALPCVKIRVLCSKGTYIRTLCNDIGEALGCGAAMVSLLRTQVGRFFVSDAFTLAEVEKRKKEGILENTIVPIEEMFSDLEKIIVFNSFQKLLENGNCFYPAQCIHEKGSRAGEVRVYSETGQFYGIYAWDMDKSCYQPVKMFFTAN